MVKHTDSIEQKLQLEASSQVYEDGLSMDYEDIENLLSQPREKIIHDMELLIRDVLDNSAIYEKLISDPKSFEIIDIDFLTMALLVLGEIESEGSLNLFFEVLNQGFDWNNYWFDEENIDLLWEPFARICKNQLDRTEKYINDPKTNFLARHIVGVALVQLALNYPEFRQQVIDIFVRQIKFYINHRESQSEDDRVHMGTVVWDLSDLGSIENLPLVRQVFDLKLMDEDILGDFSKTEKLFKKNNEAGSAKVFRKMMPLTDRHAWFWEKINEENQQIFWDDDDDFDEDFPGDLNEEEYPFFNQITSPWDNIELEPVKLEETNWLYLHGFDIEPELINRILAAPRTQLISDLENILKDAAKNHASLVEAIEEPSEEKPSDFVVHALFFLAELEATESLPLVLDILRMHSDWQDFWIGDLIFEDIWEVVYKLGRNQLDLLLAFMKDDEADPYCRSVISDAVEQVAWHEPERRDEVLDWFKAVLQNQQSWESDSPGFSTTGNGFTIDSLINLQATELLPDIKALFEMNYVNPGVAGDYEEVISLMESPCLFDPKRNIMSLENRYRELHSDFSRPERDTDYFDDHIIVNNEPVVKPKKIGRNDPCPCGSGKKYKKCCMLKDI